MNLSFCFLLVSVGAFIFISVVLSFFIRSFFYCIPHSVIQNFQFFFLSKLHFFSNFFLESHIYVPLVPNFFSHQKPLKIVNLHRPTQLCSQFYSIPKRQCILYDTSEIPFKTGPIIISVLLFDFRVLILVFKKNGF